MDTAAQLNSLRTRCLRASLRGHAIARVGHYAKALGGSGEETSAAELLALCDAALGKAPMPAPAPASDAAKTLPPPPMEEEEASEEAEPEGYATWSKDELYAEAKDKDIKGRTKMSKDELVAALEAVREEDQDDEDDGDWEDVDDEGEGEDSALDSDDEDE